MICMISCSCPTLLYNLSYLIFTDY